ncbi:hypothetical protein [Methylomonas sp. HYX-M1]|uniref:hypothetical protein n=1 Tax=Methylomonas sp. HYX-M1 TaxID=3139307 RepID=UPI00345BFDF8
MKNNAEKFAHCMPGKGQAKTPSPSVRTSGYKINRLGYFLLTNYENFLQFIEKKQQGYIA